MSRIRYSASTLFLGSRIEKRLALRNAHRPRSKGRFTVGRISRCDKAQVTGDLSPCKVMGSSRLVAPGHATYSTGTSSRLVAPGDATYGPGRIFREGWLNTLPTAALKSAWQRATVSLLILGCWLALQTVSVYAQDATPTPIAQSTPLTYNVVAGDTPAAIATRFGVSVEALMTLNNISDPRRLRVGQQLLLPNSTDAPLPQPVQPVQPPIEQALPAAPPTFLAQVQPGETFNGFALRYGIPLELLATLNQISTTARLAPSQTLALPLPSTLEPTFKAHEPLRFGAVTHIIVPDTLAQGRTARLVVQTSRPLSMRAQFDERPLPLMPINSDGLLQFALIPAPALLETGWHELSVSYATGNGVNVARTWLIQVIDGGYAYQEITLPPEKNGLLEPSLVQAEFAKVSAAWTPISPALYWTGVFSRPVATQYNTSSPFGTRRTYNGNPALSYHAGQDFSAPAGVPVSAPGGGVVVLAEPLQVRGNAVIIDHGGGIYTGYWHLSELRMSVGQTVTPGDVIGLVGTTGLSTGAHLHWEMRVYGVAVDPTQFLSEALLVVN